MTPANSRKRPKTKTGRAGDRDDHGAADAEHGAHDAERDDASMQQTLRDDVELEGIGVHTGRVCRMIMRPAGSNTGIRFRRVDLPRQPIIPATVEYARNPEIMRCTILGLDEEVRVETPEHVLACCGGLGIDNALIEVDQPECPILISGCVPESLRSSGACSTPPPRLR